MRLGPLGLVTLATSLLADPAESVTRHVPADHPSIGAALYASSAGDVVEVAPGIYYEHLTIDSSRDGVVVRATLGPSMTTISGWGIGRCLLIAGVGPGTVIQGFTLTHGYHSTYGGGLLLQGSWVTIRDCIIERNDAGTGGGIYSDAESNPRFERCVIRNNRALWGSGGGTYADHIGGGYYEYCQFSGNTAAAYGGGIMASERARPRLDHCTVVANGGELGGGNLYFTSGSGGTLTNCLIAFPTAGANVQGGLDPGASSFGCCDLYTSAGANVLGMASPIGSNGNFSADPLICDVGAGDFGLGTSSPCASANNQTCQLVGAFDAHCGVVPTVRSSWGRIKAAFR